MSEGERMRIPLREWRSAHWVEERYGERPVIGRITQLTDTPSRVMNLIQRRVPIMELPSGEIIATQPLYMLYVFRQDDQAGMIVNRVSPFRYEQMYLTDLEMQVVMDWAARMSADRIGRFSPADGGWMWWRK